MPSIRFSLAFLMMCMLACVRSRRTENVGQVASLAQALPPRDEVAEGLKAAEQHAGEVYQAALEKQKEISASMAEDVKFHRSVSLDHVTTLNTAIQRSASARELHGMVTDHSGLADEFFRLIADFQHNKAQMRTVRDETEAQHAAQKATSERAMKVAQDKMKEAAERLAREQQQQETSSMGSLLDLWAKIQESHEVIERKDAALNADVHKVVHEGTDAVAQWANGELQYVCNQYLNSERKEVQDVKAELNGSHDPAGKVFASNSLCGAMMKQLAA